MVRPLLSLFLCSLLSGCAAHVVEVDIVNQTAQPIRNVEITFGGGTYGKSSIAGGATNHNRIKIFNLAPIQVQFDDAAGRHLTSVGPQLARNAEGTLTLTITDSLMKWDGQGQPK